MTRRDGSPRTASRAGAAEIAQRPLTVTARPAPSVTSASRAAGKTRPGAAPPVRPGQGRPAGRRGSVFSPNGMGVTWSPAFLPPPRTGRSTASCPSMACTRMAARATRSLTTVSPHSASCCPTARITWSGASRSEMMPPWAFSSPGAAGCHPSSCQRTRSATAVADSSPSCRQRLLLSRPPAQPTVTCTRTQASPRAARPSCRLVASALAANTTGSACGSGGSNSWTTDRPRAAAGSRAAGSPGRGPAGARTPPRGRTCWPRRGPAARRNPRACASPAGPAVRPGPGRAGRSPAGRPGTSPSRPAVRPYRPGPRGARRTARPPRRSCSRRRDRPARR